MISRILPTQRIGSSTGATQRISAGSRTMAIKIFMQAKKRLLNINQWHEISGKGSARFTLTDNAGNTLNRLPGKGDLIKIELPAPGNEAGGGYDWVRIEEFEDRKNELKDEEIFGFRVRPVRSPLSNDDNAEAHFYSSTATSTFLVTRLTNVVTAAEKGRNETVNTGVKGLLNKIRNLIIAIAAMLGLSKPQWKGLVNGLLHGAPEERETITQRL